MLFSIICKLWPVSQEFVAIRFSNTVNGMYWPGCVCIFVAKYYIAAPRLRLYEKGIFYIEIMTEDVPT